MICSQNREVFKALLPRTHISVTRHVKRVLAGCIIVLSGLLTAAAAAKEKTQLDFAVLAFVDKHVTVQRWQPIIDEVNTRLLDIELRVRALNLEEMHAAVQQQDVDFALLNSALYIELAQQQGLSSPLATMVSYYNTVPLPSFGGVILVRDEPQGITQLEQLKGRTVATPGYGSLGGYLAQIYELRQHGIEPNSFNSIVTKMPHYNAINAVLQGKADAAFVRTGVLEELLQQGAIAEGELRVLNAQRVENFPQALSTQLYPEWPLTALAQVKADDAAQVAAAFLAIKYEDSVFKQANVFGFSIPADYEPVRDIMRQLKVKPYHLDAAITWQQTWEKYKTLILLIAICVGIIVGLSIVLLIYNRRLSNTLMLVRKNEESQRLAAVAFETQEAILITDAHEKILRVNKAFERISGYSSDEVVGKTPRIFKSEQHDKQFYQRMWYEIQTEDGWHGEIWNRKKNGAIYPIQQMITAVKDEQGRVVNYLATFADITARKQAEERIHQLAFYDPLTGLANRRLLEEHIRQAMHSSERTKSYCALMFIDLDHFKQLNDTYGYPVGDELLKQVAKRIRNCVHASDSVARQAGDDFVVLLQKIGGSQDEAVTRVQHIAEKILEAIVQPYQLFEHKYVITASVGVNLFQAFNDSAEELLKRSDMAMYQAKAEGRHTIRFFDLAMQEVANKRVQIETELRRALDEEHFVLFYQPKVNYQGKLQGYEALLRWQHPEKGLISPMDFIPVAEETGLIVPIGQWVIQEACKTLAKWQSQADRKGLILAINISARQFKHKEFVADLTAAIDKFQVRGEALELELTESLLLENIEDAIGTMTVLKKLGIRFSLDDFGTGYSSLNYLKDLPLDSLKIDQSFVRDMLSNSDDAAIVETVITLAKSLRLSVIAEGVEEAQQADFLHELGCDLLQGYFFGRPSLIHFD